ncbi:hypothetical protein DPMN_185735 [Dreissena polymorpha]|uniref:CCHC-type domain-containing protein n=1 Tax=Dreissena polymorpha TaxID=45954 RepID=A0A9D4DLZ7_DREPO|nr:hypothetical protein DPMN_185735 [Dreissena polymorpha]
MASQNRLVKRSVKLEEKMDLLMDKLGQLLARPIRSSSPSSSRTRSPARNARCDRCNEIGHMARDCPNQAPDNVGDTHKRGRKVSFIDLKVKGSE